MLDFDPEGRLYIDGEFRESIAGGRFDVRSPSDESVVGTAVLDARAGDVAAAVGAARRAADESLLGHRSRLPPTGPAPVAGCAAQACGGG